MKANAKKSKTKLFPIVCRMFTSLLQTTNIEQLLNCLNLYFAVLPLAICGRKRLIGIFIRLFPLLKDAILFKELSMQWKSSNNAIVHERSVGFLTKHSSGSRISQWSPSPEWVGILSLDQFSQRPLENGEKRSGCRGRQSAMGVTIIWGSPWSLHSVTQLSRWMTSSGWFSDCVRYIQARSECHNDTCNIHFLLAKTFKQREIAASYQVKSKSDDT